MIRTKDGFISEEEFNTVRAERMSAMADVECRCEMQETHRILPFSIPIKTVVLSDEFRSRTTQTHAGELSKDETTITFDKAG